MSELTVLNKYFLKYKYHFVGGILFVTIANYLGVLPPKLIREAIDEIIRFLSAIKLQSSKSEQDLLLRLLTKSVVNFALLVFGLSLLKGFFMFLMRQSIIVMSRWIEFDQKNELFNFYIDQPISFFKTRNTGDLMARISEDVGKVRMYIGPGLMYGINLVILFVLVITAMLKVNAILTLCVLLPLPFLSVGIFKLNTLILQKSTLIQKKLGFLNTFSQESFSGIRILRSFGKDFSFKNIFEDHIKEYKGLNLDLARIDSLFFPMSLMLIGLSTIITVFVGGLFVYKGQITPGNIAEFVIYINMLTWPVTSIGWVASIIQQASASQKRINEILEYKSDEKDINTGLQLDQVTGGIIFERVGFNYPSTTKKVLNNVSFELKPGQTLGIIGLTGSGKSTIAHLIAGVYSNFSGDIFIDGLSIRDISTASIRKEIGYVQQDPFLFSMTIKENLLLANSLATTDEIAQAIEMADLKNTIVNLPNGTDTILGERGVNLSGGQKQRLSIARMLLRKPSIYLFDDCTSALDTETEANVMRNLKQIAESKNTIIISHRVKSVQNSDLIIVLNNGEIEEYDTHDALLLSDGLYSSLYKIQQIES